MHLLSKLVDDLSTRFQKVVKNYDQDRKKLLYDNEEKKMENDHLLRQNDLLIQNHQLLYENGHLNETPKTN